MTNVEFCTRLKKVFNEHRFMKNRDVHTVNELLYVLEHKEEFGKECYNISIITEDDRFLSIQSLDSFVDCGTRSILFEDNKIDFEVDEFEANEEIIRVNCITIYGYRNN